MQKESCKLGCLYGASVEMRFPVVTEMQSGPAGNDDGSGDTGSSGASADSGNSGSSGNTGPTGDDDQSGNSGSSGASGDTGDSGGSGDTGPENEDEDEDDDEDDASGILEMKVVPLAQMTRMRTKTNLVAATTKVATNKIQLRMKGRNWPR